MTKPRVVPCGVQQDRHVGRSTVGTVLLLLLWSAGSAGAGARPWTGWGPNDTRIRALAVSPASRRVVYAGTTEGVYRSVDGGRSWMTLNTGLEELNVQSLAIAPHAPEVVFAGTHRGLYKSMDAGVTWVKTLQTWSEVRAIDVDPSAGQVLYAGTEIGDFYTSLDGGESWTQTSTEPSHAIVLSLLVDPTAAQTIHAGTYGGGGGVWISTDGTETWRALNAGLATTRIRALARSRTDPKVLYAGATRGRLYRTTDGGASWRAANTGLPHSRIQSIAIVPGTPAIVYAGTSWDGVYASVDAGSTWTSASAGLGSADVTALAFCSTDPSLIYAGTNGDGVYSMPAGSIPTAIHDSAPAGTGSTRLMANVPNPFNATTTIGYVLAKRGYLSLCVYSLNGQMVRELVRGVRPAGSHWMSWDGRDQSGNPVGAGVYVSLLQSGSYRQAGKMVLVK